MHHVYHHGDHVYIYEGSVTIQISILNKLRKLRVPLNLNTYQTCMEVRCRVEKKKVKLNRGHFVQTTQIKLD